MKFLINSKYMHAKVAQAIGMDSTTITSEDRTIIFTGDGGVTEMEIEPVHTSDLHMEFLSPYWRDVVRFLKTLPEQPLTVEISYSKIEIYAVSIFQIEPIED